MRVAILGTGALGCVFAGRLSGHVETWMLGSWAESVAAVRGRGVRVEEPDGTTRVGRVLASDDPAAVPSSEVALILVKSYQTERAAAWASRVLAPTGLAVTLQNGLDNASKLTAALGEDRVAQGVTYAGATLLGPGSARFVASLPTFVDARVARPGLLADFVSLLNSAGLEAHATDAIEGRLWGKAVANAAINPLSALWRVPNGEVCAGVARRKVMAWLAKEASRVARARCVTLPFDDAVAYVESVCHATAENRSSMLQDVEHGRPTEIDSINGVIVTEAGRLGMPVPYNEMVWQLVRGITAPQ